MSFTYKGDLRASKTVDGVTHYYYYSGNNIVSEVWGDKSLTFLYDESGVYGFIYDDGTTETLYYYLKNLQGDVICLLDETLQPVVYYHYNAYGELIKLYEIVDGTWDEISLRTVTDHIAFINPLRYRSYYYDNDLKLYYLTTRYYDCVTGRFINADGLVSTGQSTLGFNMFAYCNNNPVTFADSNGLFSFPSWEDIGNFVEELFENLTSPIEAEVGIGFGLGGEIMNSITAESSRDTYVGIDDNKLITGNLITNEVSILDLDLGLGDSYNHLVEVDGERISSSGKPWDSPFDMIFYPDMTRGNQFAIGPLVYDSSGDILISVSFSMHFGFGGHASISYNLSELCERLFE